MDLFQPGARSGPLADRMRPRRFDEVVGQEHLCADGAPFRSMVESGELRSAILWGPPGVGKTTLGRLVAEVGDLRFVPFSAVMSGIKEVREVMRRAEHDRKMHDRPTVVFIDEIHRFNKAQQDAFLPHVEAGDVVLLGATTENPSFEVNAALLSRASVHVLRPLDPAGVDTLVQRALQDRERGLGDEQIELQDGVVAQIAAYADGDARRSLNALEALVAATTPDADGVRRIAAEAPGRVLAKRLSHDKSGDSHYDVASALIKSLRNSDPDAGVYWLARLLEAGEDPSFVARRLVILAAEDVGLADPRALSVAVAAQQAAHFVGMPEARFPLTQATLYLAMAPKSNSAKTSYQNAARDLRERPAGAVPMHLRNAPTRLMQELGHGDGYRYAHDDAAAHEMQCLPEECRGRSYYEAGGEGFEAAMWDKWRKRARPVT